MDVSIEIGKIGMINRGVEMIRQGIKYFLIGMLTLLLVSCGNGDFNENTGSDVEKKSENNIAVDSEKNQKQNSEEEVEEQEVFEIREKFFINQINDIFFNIDDYKNKTLRVEGMYAVFSTFEGDISQPVVYRNGPGCCSNDAWAGFLLNYDGDVKPEENDWIQVEGTPEIVVDGLYQELFLNVTKMTIKEERGAEYVIH